MTVFVYLFSNYTNGPNPPSKHSEVYFSTVELETNKEHCFICHSYTRQGGVSMGYITPYSSLDQLSSVGAHTYRLHPPSHGDLRAVRREVSAQLSPNTFSSIANRSSPGGKHNLLFPSKHSRRWEKWCKYYSSRAVIAFFASINTILTMKYNISTGCAVVDWKLYLFSFRMSRAQSRSSTIPN